MDSYLLTLAGILIPFFGSSVHETGSNFHLCLKVCHSDVNYCNSYNMDPHLKGIWPLLFWISRLFCLGRVNVSVGLYSRHIKPPKSF